MFPRYKVTEGWRGGMTQRKWTKQRRVARHFRKISVITARVAKTSLYPRSARDVIVLIAFLAAPRVFICTCVIRESLRDSVGEYIAMIRYRTVPDNGCTPGRFANHLREYRAQRDLVASFAPQIASSSRNRRTTSRVYVPSATKYRFLLRNFYFPHSTEFPAISLQRVTLLQYCNGVAATVVRLCAAGVVFFTV